MTIEEHLASRRMRSSSVILGDDCCYFLLWTLSGKMVGVQKYNPTGSKLYRGSLSREDPTKPLLKYVTYVSPGEIGVWGLETMKHTDTMVFITEGIFDAAMIHNAGFSAIALIGNDPKPMKQWLKMLPQHKIVITDNDKAGKLLAKYGDVSYVYEGAKDLNDGEEEDVTRFIRETYIREYLRKHWLTPY